MAGIPYRYSQFKSAGIYRLVYDKSTVLAQDPQVIRLVIGYSEKGPFNIPVYCPDSQTFRGYFGDISKKLEKRGVYFHRMALECLAAAPIVCLNLKKFNNESVGASTVSTDFNPKFNPIDTVHMKVEDIYDTTRFWELSDRKLNGARSVEGVLFDQYINICTTNTKASSATYFIRKASGQKVSGYNVTVNDWYDSQDEIPDFLQERKNSLISDYFAEIYVFKGKFTANQILASSTLKNYFMITDETDDEGQHVLKLRPTVTDAFGDSVDTLDALYNDETSGAIGHWIGSLIPEFKSKQGAYLDLSVLFNSDQDMHNMMMSFNSDLIYEEESANIDLSGRAYIPTETAVKEGKVANQTLSLDTIYAGTATTSVLGNMYAPVIADVITFGTNVYDMTTGKAVKEFIQGRTKIGGTMYVRSVGQDEDYTDDAGTTHAGHKVVVLQQVGEPDTTLEVACESHDKAVSLAKTLGVSFDTAGEPKDGIGTYWEGDDAFMDAADTLAGPERVITALTRLESVTDSYDKDQSTAFTDVDDNLKPSFLDVTVTTASEYRNKEVDGSASVYGSSVSFINFNDSNWQYLTDVEVVSGIKQPALICKEIYDKSLISVLQKGQCIIAKDGTVDLDENGEADDQDNYYDNVYISDIDTKYDVDGNFQFYYILLSGEPYLYEIDGIDKCLVRVDAPLNQETGTMKPVYLEGYTYENAKPDGTNMYAKLQWQKYILSALTEYQGIHKALLSKAELDYRYIIDTFESYPDEGLKDTLAYLAKEKQSAMFIGNFPSVQTFIKCPYTSFTDAKGVFNVKYVVEGLNKKKAAAVRFSLPDDANGASFAAYYTPLKFSDGFVDDIRPSAAFVSNLFIQKYTDRHAYNIVAGPNYGVISASGLVGPDYRYYRDELDLLEPFGVNCMVYHPSFGTFINSNQTAKQTPVSALSKVNVRELVIFLQDEIEKLLQSYQWEFNNERTRNAIKDKADQICAVCASNGGILAYLNTMDSSNNTSEIIDNEMAILSTSIEPGHGCGKMIQELTLYKTGQISASITDGLK